MEPGGKHTVPGESSGNQPLLSSTEPSDIETGLEPPSQGATDRSDKSTDALRVEPTPVLNPSLGHSPSPDSPSVGMQAPMPNGAREVQAPLVVPIPVNCQIDLPPLWQIRNQESFPRFFPANTKAPATPGLSGTLMINGNGFLEVPEGDETWTLQCDDGGQRKLPANSKWTIHQGTPYPAGFGYGWDTQGGDGPKPLRVVPAPPLTIIHEGTEIRFAQFEEKVFVMVVDGSARITSPPGVGVNLVLKSGQSILVRHSGGKWYAERRYGQFALEAWKVMSSKAITRSGSTPGPNDPDSILQALTQHRYTGELGAELEFIASKIGLLRDDLTGRALLTTWLAAQAQGRADISYEVQVSMKQLSTDSPWRQYLEALAAQPSSP